MTSIRVIVLLGLGILIGWRVIAIGMADLMARSHPEQALALDAGNPTALFAIAEQRFANKDPEAAASIARHLLSVEPLHAEAFVLLARIAESESGAAIDSAIHDVALRRSPRDLNSRARIIDTELRAGEYAKALGNVDILLRISPQQGERVYPTLARLADLPRFANSLVHALGSKPAWRGDMLLAILAHNSDSAVDQVYGPLQRNSGLSLRETGLWLDWLVQNGRWGEAYSRWASGLGLLPGTRLPLLYNGDFQTEPSNIGFDWRISDTAGVMIDRVPDARGGGTHPVKVTFLNHRVEHVNFEQTILLAPGEYRLRFLARAQDVRSDRGLAWVIGCFGAQNYLESSAPLKGSFAWTREEMPFVVPKQNCSAQRVWLENPGAAGPGKLVSGDIWFDDFSINRNKTSPLL